MAPEITVTDSFIQYPEDPVDHDATKIFGFWIFLVSDCILFGMLFAAFVVLRSHTDGGPGGKELFDVTGFTAETFILLISSFTSGLSTLSMHLGKIRGLYFWMIITLIMGMAFVGLEVSEFASMAAKGATISRSGFLSAFFTLVGTHGLHVTFGLIWMIALLIQIFRSGITPAIRRKVTIVGLYWHFLDAVWIFIYTVVYLMGVM
jgi:cytochrome o ubiquinol oxidase subunit 3